MKKKLLSLIAISIMAIIPFKVSAATYRGNITLNTGVSSPYVTTSDGKSCKVRTDYFLFYSYKSTYDLEQNPDVQNIGYNGSSNTAYVDFREQYSLVSQEQLTVSSNTSNHGNTTFNINEYFDVIFAILEQNTSTTSPALHYTSIESSNGTVTYHIHHKYKDDNGNMQTSYPFFWYDEGSGFFYNDTDLSNTLRNSLISDLKQSVRGEVTTEITRKYQIENPLAFSVKRTGSISVDDLQNRCINMTPYINSATGSANTDPYNYCIAPAVYKISYFVDSECTSNGGSNNNGDGNTNTDSKQQYTVKYHKNDGTDVSNSYTSDKGSSHTIINGFERDGYKFVGWSTNKDATQADSTYDPGKTYTVNGNLDLYAVWVKVEGSTGTTENEKTGLGYSLGILGTILAGTGAGVVYFKKRNKFENI